MQWLRIRPDSLPVVDTALRNQRSAAPSHSDWTAARFGSDGRNNSKSEPTGARQTTRKTSFSTVMSFASNPQQARKSAIAGGYDVAKSLVLYPQDPRYISWFFITICTTLITCWYEGFALSFREWQGLSPFDDGHAAIEYLGFGVFSVDMIISFCLAFVKDEVIIDDLTKIQIHYLSFQFWADLLALVPFDFIILAALGLERSKSHTAHFIALLRLLRLIRMYRMVRFFHWVEYNLTISLLYISLARNLVYAGFTVHYAACAFHYIGRQYDFDKHSTWWGNNMELVNGKTDIERYIYSMYWSTTMFATVGFGSFRPYSVPETVFVIGYIAVNIALGAYIMGTITVTVVKGDKMTGRFRDRMYTLTRYAIDNDFPEDLRTAMAEHLRMQHTQLQASDEAVLSTYPTTLRRKILRGLYLKQLRNCYLFRGCRQKFLDALLAASRVEVFMPQVEVLAEGDHVNELSIIVSGYVEVDNGRGGEAEPQLPPAPARGRRGVQPVDDDGSGRNSLRSVLGAGEVFGDIAFFTEVATVESVRSLTKCRVMVISRTAYESVAMDFPIGSRLVLENLQARAQEVFRKELEGFFNRNELRDLDVMGLAQDLARGMLLEGVAGQADHRSGGPGRPQGLAMHDGRDLNVNALNLRQRQVMADLLRVSAVVTQHIGAAEEARSNEFLYAATRGDADRVKTMLQQGHNVNCHNADNRTALMLAAHNGHKKVVKQLLLSGADTSTRDVLGGTVLLEACKAGFESIIEILVASGAKLELDDNTVAALMCSYVYESDLTTLKHLLRAGAKVDARDYDQRTALHVAAAQGNLAAAQLLVMEGRAELQAKDRWAKTPIDEARRVGALEIVDFLEPLLTLEEAAAAREKYDAIVTRDLLYACSLGTNAKVLEMLSNGVHPDSHDYDGRTGLMLACMKGHKDIVAMLLAAGCDVSFKDNVGNTALLEACKAGHEDIMGVLIGYGARLDLGEVDAASRLCTVVLKRDEAMLRRLIRAGIDLNASDYDKRTALHVAAAEGNLAVVQMLVEEGKASLQVRDRWNATPLEEAYRVDAAQVIHYLESRSTEDEAAQALVKFMEQRTNQFLYAAARGDASRMKKMLQQDCSPDTGDYDNRTALMLAAAQGHKEVVQLLLNWGADPSLKDNLGSSAMLEACKAGQDEVIDILRKHAARLDTDVLAAATMCSCVVRKDIDMLMRMIRAGADVNVGTYDSRTPLHTAAAEGHMEAVQVLVQHGRARFDIKDRFGASPMDEARRVNAHQIVDYFNAVPRDYYSADAPGRGSSRLSLTSLF